MTPRLAKWHRLNWAKGTAIVAALAATLAVLLYMSRPEPAVNREAIASTAQSKISDPGTTTSGQGTDGDEGGFRIRPEVAREREIAGVSDRLVRALATQPQRLLRLQAAFQRWYLEDPRLASKLIDLFCDRLGVSRLSDQEQVWTATGIGGCG